MFRVGRHIVIDQIVPGNMTYHIIARTVLLVGFDIKADQRVPATVTLYDRSACIPVQWKGLVVFSLNIFYLPIK